MRNILILIVFALPILTSAQRNPTKKDLKELFSEKQDYPGQLSWENCNDDSAYFQNDTIKFYYRNQSCFKQNRCCEKISWTFYGTKKLELNEISLCQEPPIISNPVYENPHHIKIITKSETLELHITSQTDRKDVFQFVELRKCEGDYMAHGKFGYELVLKRIK
jgi:hypothetical protein